MNQDTKQPWILTGYRLFDQQGPVGLKVEVLAREVGKSKSSFYHHFADLEAFTEAMLVHHLQQSRLIAEQEAHSRAPRAREWASVLRPPLLVLLQFQVAV